MSVKTRRDIGGSCFFRAILRDSITNDRVFSRNPRLPSLPAHPCPSVFICGLTPSQRSSDRRKVTTNDH